MRIWIICLGSLLLSSLSLCAFISNVSPDNRASICLFARFSYMLDFTFLTTQFRIRPNQNANKLCTIRKGFFHFSFNSMRETLKEYFGMALCCVCDWMRQKSTLVQRTIDSKCESLWMRLLLYGKNRLSVACGHNLSLQFVGEYVCVLHPYRERKT